MKILLYTTLLLAFSLTVNAQEFAEVVSVQPVIVNVDQTHCQDVLVTSDNSSIGTVIGGVTGGIVGNQVGDGRGQDAATVAGVIIGGMVGNRIGKDQTNQRYKQQCQTVPIQIQRGEIVTFKYKDRIFSQRFD
jgi:uncharacterized protein YcfJ